MNQVLHDKHGHGDTSAFFLFDYLEIRGQTQVSDQDMNTEASTSVLEEVASVGVRNHNESSGYFLSLIMVLYVCNNSLVSVENPDSIN
jgi:hypothetical protein